MKHDRDAPAETRAGEERRRKTRSETIQLAIIFIIAWLFGG